MKRSNERVLYAEYRTYSRHAFVPAERGRYVRTQWTWARPGV